MPASRSIFDPPEETPPGLDAIRAWFRKPRPRLRGLWLWIRLVLSGIADGFRFLKKHWPAARDGIHKFAAESEKVARGAVKIGHAARDVGGGIVRGTRAFRGPDGKVGGAIAKVRKLGRGVREFGGRMTEGGTGFATAFSGIRRLTGFRREERRGGLGLLDPPAEADADEPESEAAETPGRLLPRAPHRNRLAGASDDRGRRAAPKPKPVADPPKPPKDTPPPDAPDQKPAPAGGTKKQADPFEGLPREFIPQARAVRIRPPDAEGLRILILEICRRRDWTTPKQLAGWFEMHRRSLSSRHIRPLVKAGLLERKFPDSPNTPKQAYRTRRDPAPPNPGAVPPAAAKS